MSLFTLEIKIQLALNKEKHSPQHPWLLGLNNIEEHEDCVEQVVPAL